MHTLKKMVFGLGLAALLANPAMAQGQRGFGGMGGNLLGNEGVQKELKVDDAQKEKIKKFTDEMREKMMGLRDASQEERQEKMAELNKASTKFASETLKPEQLKRYNQISLQVRGLQAFTDAEVASKLKLTDEQKDKIKSINEETQSQMRDIFQDAGDDRQAAMTKITALRKESFGKAVALLTSEQKAAWKELTGEPFEVTFQPRRPNA